MGKERDEAQPPPTMAMMQLLFGKQLTYSLSGVARLGVADHMDGEPRPVEEIAAKAGAHAPSLYRVMRMLASFGVFREGPPRQFALTPIGELLRTDAPGSMRCTAMMFGEEFSTRAYEHIAACLRTGTDGVSKAYGKPIWDVLAERPSQCETFQNAMTASTAIAAEAIVEAYDFSGIERLADVGGGHGLLLASILRAYPNLHGVLFDRPEVIASVPKEQFAGLEGRVDLEAGSFFERVPDACDAYLMKYIIHDWSDAHCRTILSLMREEAAAARPRAPLRDGGDRRTRAHARQAARHRDAGGDGGRQGAHGRGIRGPVRRFRLAAQPHRADVAPDLRDRGRPGLTAAR